MVTGDGLKTIDAVRGTFTVTEIPACAGRLRRALRAGGGLMAVTVKLPTQLRDAAGGATAAQVDGGTVGEALNELYEQHGELRERIADGDGSLRRFVNVYLKRRGHPLPRGPRDPGHRRRRGHDPPGGSGRMMRTRREASRRRADRLVRVLAAAHGRGRAGVLERDRGAGGARARVRLGDLRRGRDDARPDARRRAPPGARARPRGRPARHRHRLQPRRTHRPVGRGAAAAPATSSRCAATRRAASRPGPRPTGCRARWS